MDDHDDAEFAQSSQKKLRRICKLREQNFQLFGAEFWQPYLQQAVIQIALCGF